MVGHGIKTGARSTRVSKSRSDKGMCALVADVLKSCIEADSPLLVGGEGSSVLWGQFVPESSRESNGGFREERCESESGDGRLHSG